VLKAINMGTLATLDDFFDDFLDKCFNSSTEDKDSSSCRATLYNLPALSPSYRGVERRLFLTLKEPWYSLIKDGQKSIEYRTPIKRLTGNSSVPKKWIISRLIKPQYQNEMKRMITCSIALNDWSHTLNYAEQNPEMYREYSYVMFVNGQGRYTDSFCVKFDGVRLLESVDKYFSSAGRRIQYRHPVFGIFLGEKIVMEDVESPSHAEVVEAYNEQEDIEEMRTQIGHSEEILSLMETAACASLSALDGFGLKKTYDIDNRAVDDLEVSSDELPMSISALSSEGGSLQERRVQPMRADCMPPDRSKQIKLQKKTKQSRQIKTRGRPRKTRRLDSSRMVAHYQAKLRQSTASIRQSAGKHPTRTDSAQAAYDPTDNTLTFRHQRTKKFRFLRTVLTEIYGSKLLVASQNPWKMRWLTLRVCTRHKVNAEKWRQGRTWIRLPCWHRKTQTYRAVKIYGKRQDHLKSYWD